MDRFLHIAPLGGYGTGWSGRHFNLNFHQQILRNYLHAHTEPVTFAIALNGSWNSDRRDSVHSWWTCFAFVAFISQDEMKELQFRSWDPERGHSGLSKERVLRRCEVTTKEELAK